MEIKTTRLSIFDRLELKEATFRNQSFPDHFHDAFSIGIIEKGIERVSFTGKDVLAHANSVVVINPYDIHANSCYDTDPWKYRIIYISPDVMQYVQRCAGLFCNKTIWFPKQLIEDACLYRMVMHFHLDISGKKLDSLNVLLTYLVSHYASLRPESEYKCMAAITDAAGFMQDHFPDKIIIDDLAEKYGMDKYTFIRSFKKQTGLTPVSYLLLHRINHAKTLIVKNIPIVSVALETGFYDQSHFTHYFKKYIGISPLLYKKGFFSTP